MREPVGSTQIREIKNNEKRMSVASTPIPIAFGVIVLSKVDLRIVATIAVVAFIIFLSRKDPKAIRGPLQNWRNLIPGTLTNQSESRTYVG